MMHAQARQDVSSRPFCSSPLLSLSLSLSLSHFHFSPHPLDKLSPVRILGGVPVKVKEDWTWADEMIDDTVDEIAFHKATVWV